MHPTKFWPFQPTNGDRPHIREDAMCKLTGGIYLLTVERYEIRFVRNKSANRATLCKARLMSWI